MLKQKDLEGAVGAGIITEDQLDALNEFAAKQRKARAFALGKDERFRLLGGFNDFFVANGVILLGAGLLLAGPAGYLLGMVLMWGLAEYLTGKLRLTAPSIVIAIFLVILVWSACVHVGIGKFIPTALATTIVAGLHYFRFRLPFTVSLIAVTGLTLLLSLFGAPLFESNNPLNQTIIFVYGLVVFGLAMWFDQSDTERITRRADKGFWLHLVAAPMIAHPLISYLSGGTTGPGEAALIVLLVATVLATIALLIDRRALVIVSLSYLAGAITYGVTQLSNTESVHLKSMVTLLLLGTIIVVLGVGWHRLRRMLMHVLPDTNLKSYLPPIHEGS